MNLCHPQLQAMANILFEFITDVYLRQRGRVLILYGSNGCGKTHAVKAVRSWFNAMRTTIGPVHRGATTEFESQVCLPDCNFVNWPGVVDGIKKEQWIIFENLMVDYVAIIDDLGAEHDPSGIGLEKLYLILNRREKMHTLITTNYGPELWESKFEKRITSRLFRDTIHVDLSQVPDYHAAL